MRINRLGYPLVVALSLVSAGCVDSGYDLSDIDTTTRIEVKDLVLPINIDAITLSDIIEIDEDSKIKTITIGGDEFYALSEEGDFDSEEIVVEKITAEPPILSPTSRTLEQVIDEQKPSHRNAPSADSRNYRILNMGNDFSYDAGKIDEAISEVTSVKTEPMRFHVHLDATDVEDCADKIYFSDLKIAMPKGLTATTSVGSYDKASGVWTISRCEVAGTTYDAYLTSTAVDLAANGCRVLPDHTLRFDSEFRVLDGLLTIEPQRVNGVAKSLPMTMEFCASYKLDPMTADSFCGVINYHLDGLDIAPVQMSDIPDFLSGPETNLELANPQIYLNFNNPVAARGLECSGGLTLSSLRVDEPTLSFSSDSYFTIGHDRGVDGPYNIVLAPDDKSLSVPDGFGERLRFVPFTTLGGLLAAPEGSGVHGLPSEIKISVDNPQIPSQPVTDFMLGVNIPGVKGRYELVAPLALKKGSMIVYTDTEDGWNDEDVDAITITRLSASLKVTNSCPLDAELVAYPIDVNGNRIPGVEVKSQTIPANSTDAPVTIEMSGVITHLDGVTFEARVMTEGFDAPLSPSQSITLKEIRARVSGYYEKEL